MNVSSNDPGPAQHRRVPILPVELRVAAAWRRTHSQTSPGPCRAAAEAGSLQQAHPTQQGHSSHAGSASTLFLQQNITNLCLFCEVIPASHSLHCCLGRQGFLTQQHATCL